MPDESEDSIALRRVPLSQDNESDESDHQKDIDIIEHFQSNIGEFESKWTAVLALITADDRLKTLDLRDAEAFLKDHPVVKRVLQFGWNQKSFKCVRELGALSIVIGLLSGSSSSTSDSKAGWAHHR
jgi:hypothetical protein